MPGYPEHRIIRLAMEKLGLVTEVTRRESWRAYVVR
jgi:hypothetical protein